MSWNFEGLADEATEGKGHNSSVGVINGILDESFGGDLINLLMACCYFSKMVLVARIQQALAMVPPKANLKN